MSGRNPTVASLSADLAQFQATFAALQAEVAALRSENTTLTTDLGTLRTENASLTQNLTTLRTENTTAQAVAAAAAQQLQVAQATANQAAANAAAALAAAQQGQAQPVQAGVGGGVGGGGNVVRFPAMFAATPAMVDHEQIIDYKTKTGVMVYDEGCKALTTPFDMKSNGTVVFITELQAKCVKMGWSTGCQQITHFDNSATPPKRINIIDEYGQIDVPTLLTACKVFCDSAGAQFRERARQNNTMMSECILASLTPAARVRLLPFRSEFEINDVVYAPLLHKKVMAMATIDSVATSKTLRANLRELPAFCASVKGDIEMLHSYFDDNYSQIIARGATVDDPVDILFAAYAAVPCSNFRSYIKRKHDAYTDGTLIISHDELILLANNKFNLLKSEGSWGAKSPDEERIVAMQAELTALKGQFALNPNLKKIAAPGGKKDEKGGQDGKREAKKTRNKKNTSNKKNQKQDEAWKKVAPKDGEPKEKKVKDKTFYWCHHHMAWGVHKPADCRVGQGQGANRPPAEGRNQVAAQAASATVLNPQWAALVANMARNSADE